MLKFLTTYQYVWKDRSLCDEERIALTHTCFNPVEIERGIFLNFIKISKERLTEGILEATGIVSVDDIRAKINTIKIAMFHHFPL